ncbi:MAG TPA: NAD-dependent protein deacetylase [Euzebya sp.]|nr:NAD-dependent protein deacetylase [Euzebya sp.]
MDVEPLVHLITDAAPLTILTGAGISTDSGIPDYRGTGVDRRRTPPITYREFMRDPAARRRYWARSHVGYRHVAAARPNGGHHAVTALQQAGLVGRVITQNVDGLHHRAGTTGVLGLHGRLDQVVCTSCADVRPRVEIGLRLAALNPGVEERAAAIAPDGDADLSRADSDRFRLADCRRCGGVLKPDVVFFGESMPRDRRDLAAEALAGSGGLLVLGSSLAVMSGYRLVLQAAKARQPVAILTRGPSRGDHLADVRIDAGLTEVLTEVVARVAVTAPTDTPARAVAAPAAHS